MDLNDDQTEIRSIDLNQFTVRGGKSLYKSIRMNTSIILIATVLSFYFSDPPSPGVSVLLYSSFFEYLDPTLVNHLDPYLSACPIRHHLWLSVSCSSQSSTVQGSSPH